MKKSIRTKKRRTKAKTLRNKKILLTIVIVIILSYFLIFSKFSTASKVILGAGVNITDETIIRLTGLNCSMTVVNDLIVDKLEVYPNFLLITSSITAPTYILNLPYSYSSATNITNITGIPNATVDMAVNASTFGNGIKIYSVSPSAYLTSVSWSNNNNLSLKVNASTGTNSTVNVYWPYNFSPVGISCTNCAANSSSFNSTTNIVTLTANHSSTVTWNLYTSDITPPTWSANQSSTPTTYSSTPSLFNITWNDDMNIDKVFITIRNSTGVLINNASMSNTYGNGVYNYSLVLPAGTFNWTSYANDTSNNWNASNTWVFTIGKVSAPLILSNNISWSGTYPSPTNTTGYGCPSQITCNLYRNNTGNLGSGSPKSDLVLLGAGAYAYVYNTTGNQNYSSNSTTSTLTINKASSSCSLSSSNGWNYSYGNSTTLSCSCTGDGATHLYFNNVLHDGYNGTGMMFSANAGYPVECNMTQGTNYSSATNSNTLIINKATPTFSTSVTTPITYGTASDYSGSETNTGDSDCSYVLLRNGTQISTGSSVSDITVLSAGNYNYTYYTSVCTNYTFAKNEKILTVNKATPSGSLTSDKGWTIISGTLVNVSYSESNSGDVDVVYKVWRDEVDKGSGESWTPGIGTYSYKLNITGGQNFSSRDNIDMKILTVTNKTPASCALTSSSGWTYTYPTATNIICSCIGDGSTHLYFDGTQRDSWNNTAITLDAKPSGYLVVCNITEGTNYSSSSDSNVLTISKASVNLAILNNISWSGTYPVATNTTGIGCLSWLTCNLYRNGSLVSNPETILLGAGIYNYTYNVLGNANYSSNSTSNILTIAQGGRETLLTFDKASPIVYETLINASCSATIQDSDILKLFRNGTDVTSSENNKLVNLPAGIWNYVCNITGGQNYTSATNSSSMTVNQKDADIQLFPITQTITYGASIVQSCSDNSTLLDCKLYRNNTDITSQNGTNVVYGAGAYSFKANLSDTQNYSNVVQTSTLTIDKVVPIIYTYITSPITYGANSTFTALETNIGDDDCVYNLLRNGTLITTGSNVYDITVLAAGAYNYTYYTTGCSNYTGISEEQDLIVTKAPTQTVIYLNGSTSDTSYQQPGTANITGTVNVSTLTVYLDMNATGYGNNFISGTGSITNITNVTKLALGTYNVTAHYSGNANYSSYSTTKYLTVTSTSPTYSFLKSSPSTPATYALGQSYKFNATWNDNVGISTVIFEWQGTSNTTVSTHQGSEYYYMYPSDLIPGTYSYAWYANNSNSIWTKTTVQTYIVNKSSATLSLTVSPSNSTTYQTSTIANGSVVTGDPVGKYNISLYRNGTLVSSTASSSFTIESTTLGAGLWNYTIVYNGTQNYTSTSITNITNVSRGVLSLSISGSNSTYPTSVLVNGTRGGNSGDADVNYTLWRDNVLVSSGSGDLSDTTILGVGSYSYTYNATSGNNWTANSTGVTLSVNVGQGSPALAISIIPSVSVNYPATTTATFSGCPTQGASDVNCTIWANGVLMSSAIASDPSPDVKQLPVGTYVYSYNATSGLNWTSDSTQATLTISSGGGSNGPGGSSGPGGPSGPGGGKVLYSLNLTNVPSLIEINQSSSKTMCFILENVGSAELKNISIRLSGIANNWFTASPNFIGYLNASENASICINFNIPESATAKDYQININASSKAIKSVSATLRVMAKASLSQCPSCPDCLNWTSCVNNSQTRTCYKCDETTNYACVENTETTPCEIKQPEVGTTIYIIALIVLVIAIGSIVLIVLIRRRKTVIKVEEVYRKEDFES